MGTLPKPVSCNQTTFRYHSIDVTSSLLIMAQPDLLLLDGECGMCNRGAIFLRPRISDKSSLRFVAIESKEGAEIISSLPMKMQLADSVYLIRQGKPFIRSAAIVRLLLYQHWWWKWWYPISWLIPLPIRDFIYRFIAKRRKRWFSPPTECSF